MHPSFYLYPNVHIEAFLTARALYRVLAPFYRQTERGTTVFAFAIAADLSVAQLVAKIQKTVFNTLPYAEELSVFFSALVYVS